MKRSLPVTLAGLLVLLPGLVFAETHNFAVDSAHSQVGFKVRHLVAKTPGRFNDFSGTVMLDPKNVEKTLKIEGVIKTASINTDNQKRDDHLRSADFFEVEKYPEIKFVSTKVKKKGDEYRVTGDLTIKGVTKSVDFEMEHGGMGTNPWTGLPLTGLELVGKINRKDFNIVWNKALDAGGFVLGDDVHITINIEAAVMPEQS